MHVINHSLGSHLQLPQTQIRCLIGTESTLNNMIHAERFINQPAYEYIRDDAVAEALAAHAKRQDERNTPKPQNPKCMIS